MIALILATVSQRASPKNGEPVYGELPGQREQIGEPVPFYHAHGKDVPVRRSVTRNGSKTPNAVPRCVYLSTGTVVIIPPNLISQWMGEIQKHCDPDSLRVLSLTGTTPVPSARQLAADYDVSRVRVSRFAHY